ncbi:hypothetical protein BDR26DRAFT_181236 [Obelidium mucronatum]|nr:hypothetical protein BDR26DRAFT_181236 [Obelidium mucronatum]
MFHILCTAKQPRIRLKRFLGLAISATVLFIVIFHLCSSPEGTSDATAAEYVNQHHPVIRSPVHSLLLTENYSIANSSAQYRIRLDADHPGCPIPRPALVGILTTPGLESSFRRQYLREKYRELNKKLDATKRIDVKFFFGTSNNTEIMHQLNAEYAAHPDDTIITSRMEGRDEGKILDFFQYARSILYTQHPSNRHRFCKRYLYVAKSDDDSVIHLPRLSELLLSLPAPTSSSSSSSNFVGNVFHDVITQARIQISGMHGMLYLMSADLVEWINFSPIPVENVRGVEDQQVGYWFQLSKLHINWFYVGRNRFHDLMDVNPITRWFQHRITSETVVVHYCKTLQDFFRCMSGLLEEIHVNHSLFKAENAQHRLKENGLHLPLPTIKESLQHMRDFYFTSNSTMLPLAEFDHHLLHHSITVHTGVQFTDLEMSVVMREFVNMGRRGKWIETQQELRTVSVELCCRRESQRCWSRV